MSIADLQQIPHDENSWNMYTFANKVELAKIRQAIQVQKNITLTEYVLDPLNPNFIKDFVQNVAQTHTDFNNALGLPGQDLLDVDLTKKEDLENWINIAYQEIFSAEAALGV